MIEELKKEWEEILPEIRDKYFEAKSLARKFGIKLGMPYIEHSNKEICFKQDEPRELRHPDEYGSYAYDMLNSKDYMTFEGLTSDIANKLESFANKYEYEFIWAAAW